MSVNITVTVPLDAVTAIGQSKDAAKMADAVATITRAAVESVKALPYNIKRANADEEEDNMSIKSFDSDAPAAAPAHPTKLLKAANLEPRPAGYVEIKVMYTWALGESDFFRVKPGARVALMQDCVADRMGVNAGRLRFLYGGARLSRNGTFQDVSSSPSQTRRQFS